MSDNQHQPLDIHLAENVKPDGVSGDAETIRGIAGAAPTRSYAATCRDPYRIAAVVCVDELSAMGPGDFNHVLIILRALERTVSECGGRLRCYNCGVERGQQPYTVEQATAAALRDENELIVTINLDEQPRWLPETLAALRATPERPVIYCSHEAAEVPFPHLFVDQHACGFLAARHLVQAGYQHLLCLSPFQPEPTRPDWLTARITGARNAWVMAGRSEATFAAHPEGAILRATEFWYELPEATCRRIVADAVTEGLARLGVSGTIPGQCGIIAPNDGTAFFVLDVLRALGYAPGTGVGVIGFDDEERSTSFGLTSLRPPMELMGETAARLACRALTGDEIPRRTCLPFQVVPRQTTQR